MSCELFTHSPDISAGSLKNLMDASAKSPSRCLGLALAQNCAAANSAAHTKQLLDGMAPGILGNSRDR